MKPNLKYLAPALAMVVVLLLSRGGAVFSQPATGMRGGETFALRVRFGISDTKPASWDGSLTTSGAAEVIALREWRPRPGDRILSKSSWSLSTRKGENYRYRNWEREPAIAAQPYLLIPGLIVDVKNGTGAALDFRSPQGDFKVKLDEASPGTVLSYLGGRVLVDRVPAATALGPVETENEFPSLLPGPRGEAWVAWIGYRKGSSQVLARRFGGAAWEPAQKLTDDTGDILRVKLGRDRNGHPWAVWSAQVAGNWDLFARRFDGRAWTPAQRLTTDSQPDSAHALATDAAGNLWIAWQGFRAGVSDIFAMRHDGVRWQPAEQVSTSPANDWSPAIAADSKGRVYVAWDTYDRGNYDIAMRRWENGRWAETEPVASTARYEAHVSLACDARDRLWAAWNESGLQWGKDTGHLVRRPATMLYESREIAVAAYQNGAWQEPVSPLDEALPEDLRGFNDFPQLARDAAGRIWVYFRHRMLKIRDVPTGAGAHGGGWELFGSAYDGSRWTVPVAFPFSMGRSDMIPAIARDAEGDLAAVWATDNRDFDAFVFRHGDVHYARLPALRGSPAEPALRARVDPKLTTFVAHANESDDTARIRNYEIRSGGKTYRIYRGDLHRHTEFSSDGKNDGALFDTYRYAIDPAALDFLGVTDHSGNGGPDIEYINWLQQQMADVLYVANRFVTLFSYERGLVYPNGHRNVHFAKRGAPTFPVSREEASGKKGAADLFQYLKQYSGISIPHTSATPMGTDWRDNDPAVEPLVEMFQGDRVSAEYEGAPKTATLDDVTSQRSGIRTEGYVWNAWAKGYKLGTQASSDHFSTHLSYACTLATEFTRDGLLDAMRRRHSYAATDNIILDYRMEAGGKEYLQGDIVDAADRIRLSIKVIGSARIRQIDIIKNNTFVYTRQNLGREVSFHYEDAPSGPGESYYYVRVIQTNEQMAWSSPIWIKK